MSAPDPIINPRTPGILALSALTLTVLVLTALVTVVLADDPDRPPAAPATPEVLLVGPNAVVQPFTNSILTAPVVVAEPTARSADTAMWRLPVSPTRGVRTVSGRAPELYGGTATGHPCDVVALANYLDAHADLAQRWASAQGLSTEQIPYYLNTLTPVVLLNDTWVTLHNTDGAEHAVLAADTAVLIDRVGVPRTHCASGAPLSPPADADLGRFELRGTPWPYFSRTTVLALNYAADDRPGLADEFVLLDIADAHRLTRATGGIIELGGATVPLPDPAAANVPATGLPVPG